MEWTTFLTVGQPLLIGSLFLALPAAVLVYFGLRAVLIRSNARRADEAEAPNDVGSPQASLARCCSFLELWRRNNPSWQALTIR